LAPTKKALAEGWLWYTPKTAKCVALDQEVYPATIYDRWTIPWPDWACKAPDGGVHINDRLGRIDIHVARPPNVYDEINWTCDFGVLVVNRKWFNDLEDLVDHSKIFIGNLYENGAELHEWGTVHEISSPSILTDKGNRKVCPICGSIYTAIRGGVFFSDPAVLGRPLIIGPKGIFVREDEVIRRNLRTPVGAFKPGLVRFRHPEPK
jgi:hypothetical protein